MPSRLPCLLWTPIAFLISAIALAIEVTPNLNCSSICVNKPGADPQYDNSSWAKTDGVTCDDWEYVGPDLTSSGQKWKDCLSCEQNSKAIDAKTEQNDVYWYLCALCYPLIVLIRYSKSSLTMS